MKLIPLVWVLLSAVSELTSADNFEVWGSWYGGFLGQVCFTAPPHLKGWRLLVRFRNDVEGITTWNSFLERKVDNRNFILRNNFFNGTPQPGTKICCVIEGRTKNSIKPEAVVFLSDTSRTVTTNRRPTTATRRPTTTTTRPTIATRRPTKTRRPIAKPAPMPPASSGNTPNYAEVLGKSILFYEAQRSGVLPKDNRVKWRGDSAVHDQGLHGEDLSGGWYDAGDYVKFNLPMASATTMLLWGLYTFKDAYTLTNELDNMYKSVKWPLDYFLKCWNPKTQEYYYQVGSGKLDHDYWGRPEDMHMRRPAMKVDRHTPGSDVAGEAATSLALGSIVFRQKDSAYSAKLLSAAKSLYKFAKEVPGKYPLKDYYDSSGYKEQF
ncbi:endoglucanase 4 [Patella vulgata]|uniref:endoglucanase 4 n=1 Tax=Patella vulgata TaxID=6465 RepID=UPI00217F2E48|nr:endoglucanase 4 [Patella vulgata]